jgi:hypothetical protein
MVERIVGQLFLKPRRGDIITDKIMQLDSKSLLLESYNVASTRLPFVYQLIFLP